MKKEKCWWFQVFSPFQTLFSKKLCKGRSNSGLSVNPLLQDKILAESKLRTFRRVRAIQCIDSYNSIALTYRFADDKIDVVKMMIVLLDMVETLWDKEKMLVTSIFSFSHSVFQSLLP